VVLNVAAIIDQPAAEAPDRRAVVVDEEVITYRQLAEARDRAAAVLEGHGLQPGDRCAVVDGANLLSISSILAVAWLGGAPTLMNPALKPTELAALVELSGCVTIGVAGELSKGAVESALGGRALGTEELVLGSGAGAHPQRTSVVEPSEENEAIVLFTSGTTGLPKPVPITHAVLSARIANFAQPFSAESAPTVGLMCVPLFHVGGSLSLLGSLYSGNTTVVQKRFDAGEWLALVERHRVVTTFLVPTMLQRILDHPNFATTDLSSLVAIAYGAAAAPVTLVRRAMAAMPHVAFANVFGQTETLGAYTTLLPEDHFKPSRIGSVGRALPGVELRVVDPVSGQDVPLGEPGELWVLSPQNVRPGWLHTGDLARIDEEGYVFPVGRLSETINRGGEKFGPIEVESVLREHPGVIDAAVFGVPDFEMGERVGAAAVTRVSISADELRTWCRERIAHYKVPDRFVFLEELPYSSTGKVNRGELIELLQKSA
jgi:acyl-CoA synthetase (AMP-forming)/AMP-acid ligase II